MAATAGESVRASIEDAAKPKTLVQQWTGQIEAYDREFMKWQGRVEKILKKYRDEDRPNKQGTAKFNILWSNVQTLLPATYSRVPKSDVSRRFHDNDPVGRVASLILERSLEFEMEHYSDFSDTMKRCVVDRFLGGRGTAWARYEPHIKAQKLDEPTDGDQVTDKVDEPDEELDYECAPVDYVHWRDFGHTVARTWGEVTAVWRRVYMTRRACVERFGKELGNRIPMDQTPADLKKGELGGSIDEMSLAEVYEIWDIDTKRAIWISKSMPEELDVKDDPLGLEEFFPCPKPLYATTTNESLVPIPDYTLYQDQARELDTLAERMDGLIQMLQVKGVYDDSQPVLARIFTEGTNGTLLPAKNWAQFAEKNGLAGSISLVELKPIYEALQACYEAMKEVLNQIYDLTGLSDIVRGQSEASETATAQKIKGQYASLRLKAMQYDVARFATELIQLKAQIICAKFDPQTVQLQAATAQFNDVDQGFVPLAGALLMGQRWTDPEAKPDKNPMRVFRIEVDSDTMVQIDEQEEKENRNEFITAQGMFAEKVLPLVQEAPQIAPLVASLWKFSVTGFKVGKTIEGEFDQVIDKLAAMAAQPRPPKPDAAMAQVQAQQATEQARMQMQQQIEQDKGQREMAALQAKGEMEQQRIQFEAQLDQAKRDHEAAMEAMKAQFQDAFQRWEVIENNKRAVQVAEITAQASIDRQQIQAANAAETDDNADLTDSGQEEQAATKKTGKRASAIDRKEQMHKDQMSAHQQAMDAHGKALQAVGELAKAVTKPRTVQRGSDGRIAGLQ